MANRVSLRSEALYRSRRQLLDAGRELRIARLTSGKRLRDVAAEIGVSQSRISRIERGLTPRLGLSLLARIAAAVGLRLWIQLYPVERRLLDAGQLRLLDALRRRVATSWRWTTEVPMPIAGDLRAADAVLTGPVRVMVEAWTRLADFQAQSRAAALKRRDLGAERLILLLAATSTNRRALRAAGDVARASFPVATRAALAALADGKDPGGDAIVLL